MKPLLTFACSVILLAGCGTVHPKAGHTKSGVNPSDWGPAYRPGMELGPASVELEKAFHRAEAFLAKQPFAKEYAKRACSGGGEPCDVQFALLADASGTAKGIARVDQTSGNCLWLGDRLVFARETTFTARDWRLIGAFSLRR